MKLFLKRQSHAELFAEPANNIEIGTRKIGSVERTIDWKQVAGEIGGRSALLEGAGGGQNEAGALRGLGHEDFADDEEADALQRRGD